jgi:hypothetical protein
MRAPGRLPITWQDDNTLKQDRDGHGSADPPVPLRPVVTGGWRAAVARIFRRVVGGPPTGGGGSLKVVTAHIRPGYSRKNGVPYSENVVLTEYYDRHVEPNRDVWFTVTTMVSDPKYLNREFITSTDFKKEPNESKWSPSPSKAR